MILNQVIMFSVEYYIHFCILWLVYSALPKESPDNIFVLFSSYLSFIPFPPLVFHEEGTPNSNSLILTDNLFCYISIPEHVVLFCLSLLSVLRCLGFRNPSLSPDCSNQFPKLHQANNLFLLLQMHLPTSLLVLSLCYCSFHAPQ